METINIRDIIENKITLNDAQKMCIIHNGEIYNYFDEGCTRYVFSNKDRSKVIKLLKSNIGKEYNIEEFEIYTNASTETKKYMAKTELNNGFIEQEFVLPIKFGGKKLSMKQIRFASSCRNEVGWTKDGNLVCYDLDEYKKY